MGKLTPRRAGEAGFSRWFWNFLPSAPCTLREQLPEEPQVQCSAVQRSWQALPDTWTQVQLFWAPEPGVAFPWEGQSTRSLLFLKFVALFFSLRVTLCFWAVWGAMQWLSFCGLYQGMVWEQCFECNVEAVILKPSRFNIFYYVGIEKGTGAIDLSKVLMLALCCSWRAGQPSGAKGCPSCPACLLQAGQGAAGPDESNMDILEACAGEKE